MSNKKRHRINRRVNSPNSTSLLIATTFALLFSSELHYGNAESYQNWRSRFFPTTFPPPLPGNNPSLSLSSILSGGAATGGGINLRPRKQRGQTDFTNFFTDDENSNNINKEGRDGKVERKRSPISLALASIQNKIMEDPARFGRLAATAVQIGLLVYLGKAIWGTVCEVIDEFYQEQQQQLLSAADPLYVKPADVAQLMEYLKNRGEGKFESDVNNDTNVPSRTLLQLTHKLLACGMNLRSSSEDDDLPSVESLLLELTRSEAHILQQCLWTPPQIDPESKRQMWNQISGLHSVKERLLGTIAMIHPTTSTRNPISNQHYHLQAYSSLFQEGAGPTVAPGNIQNSHKASAAHGILLYGPPGCGKTLLVRALANLCRLPCLVITPSVLLRKYVGDTNLQVRSLFSLATKLAPCILCIDELDGLFRERSESEHEVSRDLKTEFLQWWDGMMTGTDSHYSTTFLANQSQSKNRPRRPRPILVVGATNRPFDVDSAVLRRLPQSHFVGLPCYHARMELLSQLLQAVPKDPNLDLHHVALQTAGYSPSDLRQVLQTAALTGPVRRGSTAETSPSSTTIAGLTTGDILEALQVVPPTPLSQQYRVQLSNFIRPNNHQEQHQHTHEESSSSSSGNTNRLQKWETNLGNFYNVGTIEVDNQTFDLLTDIVKEMEDMDSEDDDEDYNTDDEL